MMLNRRKEKALEQKERRVRRTERETAAGRLLVAAPNLTSLNMTVSETRKEGWVTDTQHIRRFVLEHAPALFELTCSDPYCEDGGYDITREVLRALSLGQEKFEAQQDCGGRCGPVDCGRHVRVVATATYQPSPASPTP